jgi:hypothetical protein
LNGQHAARLNGLGRKDRKNFLQGLKPIGFRDFTPGLKPRPPKETSFLQAEPFAALWVKDVPCKELFVE